MCWFILSILCMCAAVCAVGLIFIWKYYWLAIELIILCAACKDFLETTEVKDE